MSLDEVANRWSLEGLTQAHEILDAFEEAEAVAARDSARRRR